MVRRSIAPIVAIGLPVAVGLFFFVILTAAHHEVPFLLGIPWENLLLAMSLGLACLSTQESGLAQALWVVGGLLIVIPFFPALLNAHEAEILGKPGYRSWVSCVLMAGPLALAFSGKKRALLGLMAAVAITAMAIFLYHYLVLGEVREFDLRPTLHTKNGDPNFMSTIFGFLTPLMIYVGLRFRPALLVAAALIGCAVLTQSRMGLIGLSLSLVYLLYQYRREGAVFRWAPLVLVIVAILVPLLNPAVVNRFRTINDTANVERVLTYRNGIRVFAENPLVGVGWGHSRDTYYEYAGFPDFQTGHVRFQIHMTPLQIAAELGVVGLLGFAALLWVVAGALHSGRKNDALLFHASVAALMSLCLNAMTLPLETKDFLVAFLFVIAVLNERGSDGRVDLDHA